jgi:excisionase family DNA binding protein
MKSQTNLLSIPRPETPQPAVLANPGRLLFRTREAAQVLGVSERKIRDLVSRGKLSAVKVDSLTRIRRSELERFCESLES